MSTMQQALMEVGFQPRLRTLRRAAERERLETVVDEVIAPITKPRKIQVQRAGGHYKARWEGESACCFGSTPESATERLKYLPRKVINKEKSPEARP